MNWTDLKSQLIEIAKFSAKIGEMIADDKVLFDFLDNLPNETKSSLFDQYKDSSGPVLSLRSTVANQIINGKVNRDLISNTFINSKKNKPRQFTQYSNLFSILYPFVISSVNEKTHNVLNELALNLQKDLNILGITSIKVNGFDGGRNTGDDHAWLAIYNNTYPNQRQAKQLFFSIHHGQISFSLFQWISFQYKNKVDVDPEKLNYESILNYFDRYKNEISNDNFRAATLNKYDISSLIEKLNNSQIRSWWIKPGKKASLWKDALKTGSIFIGWGYVVNDAINSNDYSNEFIIQKLNEHYPKEETDNQNNNKISIQSFLQDVSEGDLVFATSGRSDIIGLGVITSALLLDEEEEEFPAYRNVDWLLDLYSKPYHPSYSLPIKTVTQINAELAIDLLREFFDLKKTVSKKDNNVSMILNQILYGPPGTGKTYHSIDKAVAITNGKSSDHTSNKRDFDNLRALGQVEFVTFHQNYAYEDFMIGLRPDADSSQLRFTPYKGIFYQICKRARDNYEASKLKTSLKPYEELIEEMQAKITDDQPLEFKTVRGKPFWLTDYSEKTLYLKKSTGSEIHTLSIATLIDIAERKRDIVSGLAFYYYPVIEYLNNNRKSTGVAEELRNFVLIIDEINRANISKVFGELITLLESDKRLGQENELKVTLPNGEINFGVPPNLYLVGTMNTADKSIALIDIALRRRFEFEGKYPDATTIKDTNKSQLLLQINKSIFEQKKSADYLIGHAYFMNDNPIPDILRNKVIPLLMEYFSGKTELVITCFKETDWQIAYDTLTYSWVINQRV